MQISLVKTYKSLTHPEQFEGAELPEFTVLTGLNGSGKSQILEAIKNGSIECQGIPEESISLMSFSTIIEQQVNAAKIRESSEDFLSLLDSTGDSWNNTIRRIFDRNLSYSDAEYHNLLDEEVRPGTPIWSIQERDVSPKLWERIRQFKQEFGQEILGNAIFRAFPHFEHLKATFENYGASNGTAGFHYTRFADVLGAQTLEGLTKSYTKYVQDRLEYGQKQYTNNREGRRSDWEKEYSDANPAPWFIVNQALEHLRNENGLEGTLSFRVTNPDDASWSRSNSAKIINLTNGVETEFDDLSSGEKILFALALLSAGASRGFLPPRLLLLDEVDATLHPSMIRAMLEIIRNTFLEKNSKVILATHSPTTVAMADDAFIHLVTPGRTGPKIRHSPKNDALKVLTEGYATLQDLLQLSTSAKENIVLSEGKNYRLIRRAKEFFDPNDQIEVLNIKDFGVEQLRTVFELLKNVNRTKKFVTAWDCDYRTRIARNDEGENIRVQRDVTDLLQNADAYNRAFIFEENANSPYGRGIENLFDQEHVDTERFPSHHDGAPKKKKQFETFALELPEAAYQNFQPLFDFILEAADQ